LLAARWFGRRDIRLVDVPEPKDPPPGWIVARVNWCGICGTDIEEYSSGPVLIPTTPHPLTGRYAPLTLGHEIAATVEAVGEGVELAAGNRIAIDGNRFCGVCQWCRLGQYNLCVVSAQLGLQDDGGLAEKVLAPAYMCLPYSDSVQPDHAAFAEPLAVAVRAVHRAKVGLGDTVAIIGAGAIGLLLIQVARIAGASRVFCVESREFRRALAVKLGADAAVSPEDFAEIIGLNGGNGPAKVIEAAGSPAAMRMAAELTGTRGTTVLLGVVRESVPFDVLNLLIHEKRIITSISHVYNTDFATAVRLLDSGRLVLDPLLTGHIALADVVTQGFDVLLEGSTQHIKIVVSPDAERGG
jgi:(R,R)-butanediol dehydrogenase / meso-butanediol dehydrogenase / diacetyl reductase